MAISVKVCGITSVEAADAAVRAGADFAGLVFHPGSPRNLAPDQAARLAAHLRGRLRVVALLSDPGDETIANALKFSNADLLQLHGNLTLKRAAEIRANFGKAMIKAVPVAEADDFAAVAKWEEVADLLLFDAKPPKGARREASIRRMWRARSGRPRRRAWMYPRASKAHPVSKIPR